MGSRGEWLDGPVRTPPEFAYEQTLNGFDVIDLRTGHSMGFERDTRQSANGIAQSLNAAARQSPQALARALRAT